MNDNRELCSYPEYLRKAQAIVEASPLWKRFIDGTPLSNDIACWMVEFMYANPEPGGRIAELEAERDTLRARVVELEKRP